MIHHCDISNLLSCKMLIFCTLHCTQGGQTALFKATYGNHVNAVALLVEKGADIEAVSKVCHNYDLATSHIHAISEF